MKLPLNAAVDPMLFRIGIGEKACTGDVTAKRRNNEIHPRCIDGMGNRLEARVAVVVISHSLAISNDGFLLAH